MGAHKACTVEDLQLSSFLLLVIASTNSINIELPQVVNQGSGGVVTHRHFAWHMHNSINECVGWLENENTTNM